MSNQIELHYIKTADGKMWYFSDITRRGLIEEGLKELYKFFLTKPTREQFNQHPGIQRLLREVPECRLTYQKHICDNVVFDSHKQVL